MPGNNSKLGIIMKNARTAKNLTQERLAEITNVSLRTISNIETGKQHPRYDTVEKVITALGISRESLVSDDNPEADSDVELFIAELRAAEPYVQKIVMSSGWAILNCMQTAGKENNGK